MLGVKQEIKENRHNLIRKSRETTKMLETPAKFVFPNVFQQKTKSRRQRKKTNQWKHN